MHGLPLVHLLNILTLLMLHLTISTFFSLVTVDTSCPLAAFERIGCFKDNHIVSARPLPEYLANDRDPRHRSFSGQRIDWRNWDVYTPDFACRCALEAKQRNYTFFGMQFYGEKELFFVLHNTRLENKMNSKKSGKNQECIFFMYPLALYEEEGKRQERDPR